MDFPNDTQKQDYVRIVEAVVPPSLRPGALIAGGYATDPHEATDVDVFLYVPTMERKQVDVVVTMLQEWLEAHSVSSRWRGGPYYTLSFNSNYSTDTQRVLTVFGLGDKPIDVMLHSQSNPELIRQFDLSVHARGYWRDIFGQWYGYVSPSATSTSEPIRVLGTRSFRALAHLRRFCKRYGVSEARP